MNKVDTVFDKSIEDNEMYDLILDDSEDVAFERIFAKEIDAFVEADDTLTDAEDDFSAALTDEELTSPDMPAADDGNATECKECNECGSEDKAEGTDTKFNNIDDKIDIDDVAPAADEEYNDKATPDAGKVDFDESVDFADLFDKWLAECGAEDKAEGTDTKFNAIDDKIDIDDVAPAADEEYNDSHTPDIDKVDFDDDSISECGSEDKAEGTDTKFNAIDDKIDIDDVAPAADEEYNDKATPDAGKVDFDDDSISECGSEDKAEGTDTKFNNIDDDIDIDDVAPAEDDEYNDSHTPDIDLEAANADEDEPEADDTADDGEAELEEESAKADSDDEDEDESEGEGKKSDDDEESEDEPKAQKEAATVNDVIKAEEDEDEDDEVLDIVDSDNGEVQIQYEPGEDDEIIASLDSFL